MNVMKTMKDNNLCGFYFYLTFNIITYSLNLNFSFNVTMPTCKLFNYNFQFLIDKLDTCFLFLILSLRFFYIPILQPTFPSNYISIVPHIQTHHFLSFSRNYFSRGWLFSAPFDPSFSPLRNHCKERLASG